MEWPSQIHPWTWSTCTTVYSNNVYYRCHLLYLKWDVEKREKACSLLYGFCDINSFWVPFGSYRKLIINTCIPIDNLFSSHTLWTVSRILLQSDYCYSPILDISPILTMCGQCWSVLAKKGFVTPRITPGLKYRMTLLGHVCTFPQEEPLLGVCNSHNKPMQRHYYRPVYFFDIMFFPQNRPVPVYMSMLWWG